MHAPARLIARLTVPFWSSLLWVINPLSAAEPNAVEAIWKPIDFQFSYHGFTTNYSCDALEWKVEQIMKAVGSHEKTQVSATGCPSNGPSQQAFVRIRGALPVPATPAEKQALAKGNSRQDLLKRLGIQPDVDQDQFAATQVTVDLSRKSEVGLEAGDCELIEQLEREVFPKLGIRVVRSDAHCVPGRVPISRPGFEVAALVKVPAAVGGKQDTKAAPKN